MPGRGGLALLQNGGGFVRLEAHFFNQRVGQRPRSLAKAGAGYMGVGAVQDGIAAVLA
jgi:hypothetical protein